MVCLTWLGSGLALGTHISCAAPPCLVVNACVRPVLCCAVLSAVYGLAQRLLVMVDAACSPVGGDPFAALTPQVPGMPAPAASGSADGARGTVCGSSCSWQGCMERLRLAHEGLLLLRALVATPGDVGECVADRQAWCMSWMHSGMCVLGSSEACWPDVWEAASAAQPSLLAASESF